LGGGQSCPQPAFSRQTADTVLVSKIPQFGRLKFDIANMRGSGTDSSRQHVDLNPKGNDDPVGG
jgi:hypothetical protein